MKTTACRWTDPTGEVRYVVDTSNPGTALSEHSFRQRTWPHMSPKLVEVEIREVDVQARAELPTLTDVHGCPTEGG